MTTVHFLQLACEEVKCEGRFPDRPVPLTAKGDRRTGGEVTSVTVLRIQATERGWETKRHTKGRDLCPPCRVAEIQRLYGWAFEEKKAPNAG